MATYADIEKRYAEQEAAYEAAQKEIADRQIGEINKAYDEQLRQSYITQQQGNQNLASNISSLGLGGMSESLALQNESDYQNRNQTINANRNTDIGTVNNSFADLLAEYRNTALMDKNAEISARDAEERAKAEALAAASSYGGGGSGGGSGDDDGEISEAAAAEARRLEELNKKLSTLSSSKNNSSISAALNTAKKNWMK